MSTHGIIAMVNEGKIVGTVCQYDGYPEHLGCELATRFATAEEVKEVLKRGDIRGIENGQVEYYENGNNKLDEWNSMGELIRSAAVPTISYVYLWDGTRWIFADRQHDWTDLKAYLGK